MKVPPTHSLWRTFRWPLLIAVLSLIGLVGALLVEGAGDWISAGLLALSLLAAAWGRLRKPHRRG
jgi:hypothetical protein